ncbi:winged helix-turn-helix domain-containing protein [Candidatus Micrarchaeota archaeon]|nr:winged helix-turn-helix domain-containing protein [Candidatus Micrarchaeota archaeon]MBU2476442.1 winged helix-turn-helix domain-containing protein [Candidatus Micrarchaeota archaeon]
MEQDPKLLSFNQRFFLTHRKPDSRGNHRFQIVIRRVEQPFSSQMDEEFNWLLQCLGFFEPIDKGKTAALVFKELVKGADAAEGKLLTSTEISERVGMSRGAVINHLNNLLRSGLILRQGSKFRARSKSMFRTIKELQDEIDLVFKRMEETAKQLDEEMGLFSRE